MKKKVDILWNLQPTRGEINGYKTNIHPKLFFTDQQMDSRGRKITGSKYIKEYDLLFPETNGEINFNDSIWDKPIEFIEQRKEKMINFMKDTYDIEFE